MLERKMDVAVNLAYFGDTANKTLPKLDVLLFEHNILAKITKHYLMAAYIQHTYYSIN